jgi:hypothetical protein
VPKKELPSSLFKVGSSLLPFFVEILKKTQLSPAGLFVLSHISHYGKDYEGRKIVLGKDVRDMLKGMFHHSASKATKEISKLEERDFLSWMHLSADEKEELFGSRKGKKFALILLDGGVTKLDEFTAEVNSLYREATSGVPRMILTPFAHAVGALADEMLKRQSP